MVFLASWSAFFSSYQASSSAAKEPNCASIISLMALKSSILSISNFVVCCSNYTIQPQIQYSITSSTVFSCHEFMAANTRDDRGVLKEIEGESKRIDLQAT
jgi:hypothetical protein